MAATVQDVLRWIKDGKKQKASYLIVVCDTFNYENYPVYVSKKEKLGEEKAKYDGVNMQRVMETIDLSKKFCKKCSFELEDGACPNCNKVEDKMGHRPLNLREMISLCRKASSDKLLDKTITEEQEAEIISSMVLNFPIFGQMFSSLRVDIFDKSNRFKEKDKGVD